MNWGLLRMNQQLPRAIIRTALEYGIDTSEEGRRFRSPGIDFRFKKLQRIENDAVQTLWNDHWFLRPRQRSMFLHQLQGTPYHHGVQSNTSQKSITINSLNKIPFLQPVWQSRINDVPIGNVYWRSDINISRIWRHNTPSLSFLARCRIQNTRSRLRNRRGGRRRRRRIIGRLQFLEGRVAEPSRRLVRGWCLQFC